jgi:hypothetical protein
MPPTAAEESPQEVDLEESYEPLSVVGAVDFLLARDLLLEQTLVEGDVRVTPVPGRNHNLRVLASKGPSYFIKQVPPEELGDPRLPVEAELYRLVLRDRLWSHLQPFVPQFRYYDAGQLVLVTSMELELSEADGSRDEHAVPGLPRLGEPLARALAACHRTTPSTTPLDVEFLPPMPPGILSIGRPHPSALQYLSPAQIQLIQIVQEQSAMLAAFDRLYAEWTGKCLIHGDVKWANVLVRPDRGSGQPVGVKLVDWELAQVGEPAWDVGSVFHSHLLHAVLYADIPENAPSSEAAAVIGAALPSVYGELGTFWNTYVCISGTSGQDRTKLLSQSIVCCVARLVQSAFEWCQEETTLPGRAAAILQLGVNMLSHPKDAHRVVLGGLGSE